MGSYISTERRDTVALVTIDNPPMNALSSALLDELESELDALDGDDDVRAIVLRGGGERAFVAGADIKEFPSLRESAGEGGSARGIQKLGHRMDAARTPFAAYVIPTTCTSCHKDVHRGALGPRCESCHKP